MSFIYPTLFWALMLIIVPIIIHLFNFRTYKTVYFSNISSLHNVKNASKSKSKLKNIIILILRILTIIALVIAFARPFIFNKNSHQKNDINLVSIYLDNSFSMNASGTYGNLFDAAKERARLLVSLYNNNQKFLFVSNDLKAEHRTIANKQQMQKFISQCTISPSVTNISQIIEYINNYANQKFDNKTFSNSFYLLSDFQKNISDFEKFQIDSNLYVYCLPVATNKINNIFIDSCWFSSPGRHINKQENLNVKVINKGNENYFDILLNLSINGKQKLVNSFNIDANSNKTITLKYTNTETGILSSQLEITDYPITYDNKLYFNYKINNKTSVLIINKKLENKYLNSLFKSDSNFIVNKFEANNIKTSYFSNYQLIILNQLEQFSTGLTQELKRFVAQGGVLLCIPPDDMNVAAFNKLTESLELGKFVKTEKQASKIAKINYDHFIYKNVFTKKQSKLNLPEFKYGYKFIPNNKLLFNTLLYSVANQKMLLQTQYKRGRIYLFTFSLSSKNTNFATHPLFVPTLYNIAAFSQSDQTLYYTISDNQIVELDLKYNNNGDNLLEIIGENPRIEFIPQMLGKAEFGTRLNLMNNIVKAGNYFVRNSKDTIGCISYNYNRQESDIEHYNNNKIMSEIEKNGLKNISLFSGNIDKLKVKISNTIKERSELWKWFILLAIICIIAEILLLKLWRTDTDN